MLSFATILSITPARALRAVLLVVATLLVVMGVTRATGSAQTVSAGDTIVRIALQYEGTHGGQCWTFVRQVVQEATGNVMGFSYRDGFFEGGATEVALSDAQPGDIIQLANDLDTGPNADYPGLHTAIVVESHGDGTFTVVDSNSQWDEMVRVHEYNPIESAARFPGISARVYRFGAAGAPGPGIIPGTPASPPAGDYVVVQAGGDCLNLRQEASLAAGVIECIPDGTTLEVLGGPVLADGIQWMQVRMPDGRTGWSASAYLKSVDAPAPGTAAGDVEPLRPYRSVAPGIISTR